MLVILSFWAPSPLSLSLPISPGSALGSMGFELSSKKWVLPHSGGANRISLGVLIVNNLSSPEFCRMSTWSIKGLFLGLISFASKEKTEESTGYTRFAGLYYYGFVLKGVAMMHWRQIDDVIHQVRLQFMKWGLFQIFFASWHYLLHQCQDLISTCFHRLEKLIPVWTHQSAIMEKLITGVWNRWDWPTWRNQQIRVENS